MRLVQLIRLSDIIWVWAPLIYSRSVQKGHPQRSFWQVTMHVVQMEPQYNTTFMN